MNINERYLSKFRWTAPEEIQTELGPRTRMLAKVSLAEREAFLAWEPKFKSLAVTMKDHPKGSGNWWFIRWGIPDAVILQHERESLQMSRAKESQIEIPAPAGLEYMPYQKAAIEFMLKRKATLVGDSCGLGKTPESIGYINAMNARAGKKVLVRILVICPADLRLNWRKELRRWLVDKYSVDIVDDVFPSSDIVIISYTMLRKWEKKLEFLWCLIIADEVDYISNPKAAMTKALVGYKPKREEIKKGVMMTAGIPTKRKIAMTGTPIRNRPKNIFPIINWLDPISWPSYSQFAVKYCGAMESGRWDDNGCSNAEELQKDLRSTIYIRRLKSEVMDELPPKRRSVVVVPVNDGELFKIGRLQDSPVMKDWMAKVIHAKAELEVAKCGDQLQYMTASAEMSRVMESGQSATFELVHAIGMAKVPAAIEIIQRAVAETPKIVVFTHHRDVTQAIAKHFPKALIIDGTVPHGVRHANVLSFQEDPETGPIFVSIPCAKGITLTAASTEIFAEGSWLPRDIEQAEARCDRKGQRNSVTVMHLVMEGSIDLIRTESVISKQAVNDRILDLDHTTQEESEPIIPMPGVTISRKQVQERTHQFNVTAIAMLSEQCSGLLTYRLDEMQPVDQIILQKLMKKSFNSRTAVLAAAIVAAYSGQPKSAP